MRPDTHNTLGSWLFIGVCLIAYIFFVYNLFASGYLSVLGNHSVSYLSA